MRYWIWMRTRWRKSYLHNLHYANLRKAAAAVLRLTARGLRWLASIAAKEAPHASTVLA